ncbi:hypothetical protein [Paraburkholderia sacchari]|uniref:Uncharacterized protein n=1 Tax=Paraburkholderia sacchari TaxID=159450 RepID=A0A8T6ZHK5_9BURK|nr:hypothetical protein [Paraburkholderia sacchari]NLP64707.1 hypothetical protein [Paraburkholderia sacchari]
MAFVLGGIAIAAIVNGMALLGLRDHVFDDHPSDTVCLDSDAPHWAGNLTKVQQ